MPVRPVRADLSRLNSVVRAAHEGTTLVLCPRKATDDQRRNPMKRVWCVADREFAPVPRLVLSQNRWSDRCVEEIRETLEAELPLVIKCGAVRDRTAAAAGLSGQRRQRYVWQEEMDHGWTQQLVLSVDVEQAEASVEADRVKILEKIRAVEGGVIRVNKEVQEALWVAYTGRGLPAWQYRCS
jgi:hypothetical protein